MMEGFRSRTFEPAAVASLLKRAERELRLSGVWVERQMVKHYLKDVARAREHLARLVAAGHAGAHRVAARPDVSVEQPLEGPQPNCSTCGRKANVLKKCGACKQASALGTERQQDGLSCRLWPIRYLVQPARRSPIVLATARFGPGRAGTIASALCWRQRREPSSSGAERRWRLDALAGTPWSSMSILLMSSFQPGCIMTV